MKPETPFLLDEPTAGLHLEDVGRLMAALQRLVEGGARVLLVEHHVDVLAACDYLIEMGSGAGPDGGRIIAAGTPAQVARRATPTAPFLAERLR